jgi:Uncharacterized protein conserved in bacteria (DUF2059)
MRIPMQLAGFVRGLLIGLIVTIASPVAASQADRLADILRIGEVIDVMRDEGRAFGTELNNDMLGGQGGAVWAAQIERIYDRDVMENAVRRALSDRMDSDDIARSIAFYDTPLGQRILTLETTARQAMADGTVEEIARATFRELKQEGDPRFDRITRFVEINDLLERNVTGALNASYHFMRGLAEGGSVTMSESDMTADVWSQEDETRSDTESWLYGFLIMAYGPLSDDDFEAYIEFSETDAGQILNAALFDGFDEMYLDISHALGLMVARALETSDL